MNMNHMTAIPQLSAIPKREPLFLSKHMTQFQKVHLKQLKILHTKCISLHFLSQLYLLKSILCIDARTFFALWHLTNNTFLAQFPPS